MRLAGYAPVREVEGGARKIERGEIVLGSEERGSSAARPVRCRAAAARAKRATPSRPWSPDRVCRCSRRAGRSARRPGASRRRSLAPAPSTRPRRARPSALDRCGRIICTAEGAFGVPSPAVASAHKGRVRWRAASPAAAVRCAPSGSPESAGCPPSLPTRPARCVRRSRRRCRTRLARPNGCCARTAARSVRRVAPASASRRERFTVVSVSLGACPRGRRNRRESNTTRGRRSPIATVRMVSFCRLSPSSPGIPARRITRRRAAGREARTRRADRPRA